MSSSSSSFASGSARQTDDGLSTQADAGGSNHLSPLSSRAPLHLNIPATSAGSTTTMSIPSAAPRMPVSPPTPAPSPRPRPRNQPSRSYDANESMSTDDDADDPLDESNLDLAASSSTSNGVLTSPQVASSSSAWIMDPQALTRAATLLLPTLPSSSRLTIVSDLLMLLSPAELAQIAALVSSKLRVDFLSALPIEVSLHVLSYIEDPLTLARAGQVSRFWRSLVNDEHTWEAMCSKYRYRYRKPSTAISAVAAAAGSRERSGTPTSGTDLLASLYRRYRQRGLDPSNARDELRALHDLFLAKQQEQEQSSSGGSGRPGSSRRPGATAPSIPSMSSADLRFYEQLEQIVQEESRERYGDGGPSSPAASLSTGRAYETDSGASRMGWLSAGPAATRFPRTPRASVQSRLPALNTGPPELAFERTSAPSTTNAAPALSGPFSSWTGGLGLPWGLSELIHLPSSLTGGPPPATAAISARQPAIPPPHAAGGASRLATTAGRRTASDQWNRREVSVPRSTDAVGLGQPPTSTSRPAMRAATYAASSSAIDPGSAPGSFSYKAHFKRNYLTESNWHRGGRLLTNHVSNGGDPTCTCIAMDERYLIIGMANGNIHIFDSRSGLYERSIRGRPENGVWCIVLVSKTKGVRKDAGNAEEAAAGKGKGKDDSEGATPPYTARQDAEGRTTHITTHDDLTLVKHDVRLTEELEALKHGQNTKRKRGGQGRGSAKSNTTGKTGQASGSNGDETSDDQTLHWFHQARKALQQGSTTSSTEAARGTTESIRHSRERSTSDATDDPDMIGGYPRDLVEAGPAFIRDSMQAQARRSGSGVSAADRQRWEIAVQEMERDITRVREEHGITGQRRIPRPGPRAKGKKRADEDVEMGEEAGSSSQPATQSTSDMDDDAMEEDGENAAEDDDDDDADSSASSGEEYQGFSMGIGGTANGLGTLCGATRGFGNSSALLVSGGCDREVKVWDVATGKLKFTMQGHASTVRCLRVLDGRPIAISGGRDSTVRVWDISTGKCLRVLAGHQNSVRCLEVAGNRVATGSYDCTCRIWNVDTGECLHVLRGHYNQIYCVGFDGNKVATGSLDSTVRIWSAESGEPLALLQGHTALVGVLQLSNNLLISGGSDGRIIAYSLSDLSLLYAICAHDNSVSSLQFDEHFILTGGNDGTVRLWNLADGSFIRELVRPGDSIWKLGFREDRVVVVCKEADASLSMEVLDFRPVEGVGEVQG
ncbi:WD40 repeat-like protein [Microstroma glucosiphilum]|uniref:WD40 repeat-like protein n=1 Tax=Pseudomicrostroma glucosiphilum TaxID=1684307 RepID=A0A316U4D3_9BASI|nr:WD40 repeat-like protein [Pseudomicrostroma glucosiphilum]PWN20119.1 WD40 repeat-like protein [Pseudomicrostroma glucosiphilum]